MTPVPDGIEAELLNRVVEEIANLDIAKSAGNINLKFTDNDGIRKLNRDYAGNDYATDVLSFSYLEDKDHTEEIGDIIISSQMANNQAEAGGINLAEESAILTIHGVLHILGLDHAKASGKAEMDGLQSAVCRKVGIKYRDFLWQ